nr:MAG TPA: hypothetical protein [Caudoviricetes sp.]
MQVAYVAYIIYICALEPCAPRSNKIVIGIK